ncbi:cell filamentation protein Fic [Labedella phragmitis]|uniref:protein adenylyltransferase n=1 Tax=Labedella phragmitis TaxID=2498849 RepID=A0A3S4APH3_9MICO|nr:Fic family protein [Labedella phragmitis]RWZ53010.1 cell filamentation protein Fic [Labedella phragmitis]
MTDPRPWEDGDAEARWDGYFAEPGSPVLRNLIGATSVEALRDAENDLVEFRLLEMHERPGLVKRTFDLAHLQRIHHHLFQDVYEWAGRLRTVGLAKGDGESFMPPADIVRPVGHVAARIREIDFLRSVEGVDVAAEVAYLYDYLNFAHPFREGNGRAQREFFSDLLEVSGRGIDWSGTDREELHAACHTARNESDLEPLRIIFARIVLNGSSHG